MEEESDDVLSEEELLESHRAEKRTLRIEIQKLRKENKDKKKKKELTEQIEKLERELDEKHGKELKEFKLSHPPKEESLQERLEAVNLEDFEPELNAENVRKISKSNRRREKKAQEAREREDRIREEEKLNVFSSRNIEAQKMKQLLKERNLQMFEIKPDGDCMFASMAHQIHSMSVYDLRSKAANYIRKNKDDFAPFITAPTGEMMSDTEFETYCVNLETTSVWGGQPELRALSQILKLPIEVIQAEGVSIIFGDEFPISSKIQLAYYRHSYGLGEHYNSVTPLFA